MCYKMCDKVLTEVLTDVHHYGRLRMELLPVRILHFHLLNERVSLFGIHTSTKVRSELVFEQISPRRINHHDGAAQLFFRILKKKPAGILVKRLFIVESFAKQLCFVNDDAIIEKLIGQNCA